MTPARRACCSCRAWTTAGVAARAREVPRLTGRESRTTINSGMPGVKKPAEGAAEEERARSRRRRRARVSRLTTASIGAEEGGGVEAAPSSSRFSSARRRRRRKRVRRAAADTAAEGGGSRRRATGGRAIVTPAARSCSRPAMARRRRASTAGRTRSASEGTVEARGESLDLMPARRVTMARREAQRTRRWLYITERSSHWPRTARSNKRSQASRRVSLKNVSRARSPGGGGWERYAARWRREALWNVSDAA